MMGASSTDRQNEYQFRDHSQRNIAHQMRQPVGKEAVAVWFCGRKSALSAIACVCTRTQDTKPPLVVDNVARRRPIFQLLS
jgi:hypothetical protein